jgi:hypothetical protein
MMAALSPADLKAVPPMKDDATGSFGTITATFVTLSGFNNPLTDDRTQYSYSGETFIGLGNLDLSINNAVGLGSMQCSPSAYDRALSPRMNENATGTSARPKTDKVYFVVNEGAGNGDRVRDFSCTGNDTVLDAIAQIGGISAVSSNKMWIERPVLGARDKNILSVDWAAISRQGINSTNYKLEPGDRLVIGADPLVTSANVLGKKLTLLNRIEAMLALTASAFGNSNATSVDRKMLKELVRQGDITDDAEMQKFVLAAIRLKEEASKKRDAKNADQPAPRK